MVRFKRAGEFFSTYRFVACDANREAAAAIFARHRPKGEEENQLKEVCADWTCIIRPAAN